MRVAVIGTGIAGNAARLDLVRNAIRQRSTIANSGPAGTATPSPSTIRGHRSPSISALFVYNELNYPDLTRAVRPSRRRDRGKLH